MKDKIIYRYNYYNYYIKEMGSNIDKNPKY